MRAAILGAGGVLGRALSAHCREAGDEVLALARAACDIGDAAAVDRALDAFRPEAIYNAAAMTNVDEAERDPEAASRANRDGPRNLARAARRLGARLATVSTEYVFDGRKATAYDERDPTSPVNAYGRSKVAGEEAALAEAPGLAIVARPAWVYGRGGKNFLCKIPGILRDKGEMSAVADQWSSPVAASDLAPLLRRLVLAGAAGIFHTSGAGAASYFEVAQEAARALGIDPARITPISGATLKRPAARPVRTELASVRLAEAGLAPLGAWQESFRRFARSFLDATCTKDVQLRPPRA